MNLIHGHRTVEPPVFTRALSHPVLVAPRVPAQIPDDGCPTRVGLEKHPVRIALLQPGAIHARANLVLVTMAIADAGDERLPDAADTQAAHRMRPRIPPVEVANHADLFRIRRPDSEVHAGSSIDLPAVRAKLVVRTMQSAFAEQVQIEFRQHASVLQFHRPFGDEFRGSTDAHARDASVR